MLDFLLAKFTLAKFHMTNRRPSIDRITNKFQGFGVSTLAKHIKVCNGHQVLYFPTANVFHNLYRIVSIAGTDDYITRRVHKS